LLEAGQRVPMMSKVLINEREVLSIIDQMRISIPEDIREARRVMREREQIPQSAQMEAEQIIQQAREQAEQMLRDEEVVKEAEAAAEQTLRGAEERAESAREEMDIYALNMLRDLERRLMSHMSSIRRGIDALDQEAAEAIEVEDEEPV
jgi:hypothetical protein